MMSVELSDDLAASSEFEAFLKTEQTILEAIPMAVWVCASDGRIVRFNQRAVQLWGRTPQPGDQEKFCGSFRLYDSDDSQVSPEDGPMASVLQTGIPRHDLEMTIERNGGTRAIVLANFEPLASRAGRVQGGIAFLQDITARKQMELRVQKSEERHRQILDALPSAIYTTDAEGTITYVNRAAIDLAGREPVIGEDKWCVTWRLQRPDGTPMPHEECPMAIALNEARPVRGAEAVAFRPDGSSFAFIPYPTPIFDADGALTGAVNMLVDISERKHSEEQRGLLVAELSHRVKNTLATVISIGRQSFANPDTAEARRSFDARIRALAQTHTRLAESDWSGVLLESILFDELAPYRQLRGENVSFKGPAVTLGPKCALTLGMAFHELAMNAAIHGALSTKEGRVDVAWDIDTQKRCITVHWQESGGPPVSEPTRAGFGRMLLEKVLASDLKGGAHLRFERSGLICTISIPLDRHLVGLRREQ